MISSLNQTKKKLFSFHLISSLFFSLFLQLFFPRLNDSELSEGTTIHAAASHWCLHCTACPQTRTNHPHSVETIIPLIFCNKMR